MFLLGLLVFATGSVLSGLSPSIGWLLARPHGPPGGGALPPAGPSALWYMRGTPHSIGRTDWMEWQARDTSGAFLMPASHLKHVVEEARVSSPTLSVDSQDGIRTTKAAVEAFDVSLDTARVRLLQLGLLPACPLDPYVTMPKGLFSAFPGLSIQTRLLGCSLIITIRMRLNAHRGSCLPR